MPHNVVILGKHPTDTLSNGHPKYIPITLNPDGTTGGGSTGGASAVTTLINAATTTGAGTSVNGFGGRATFQATGSTTAGTGAATVKAQGSLDNVNWLDLGTISLTLGTTVTNDGFATDAPWAFVRGNVTAISGTGAVVSLYRGI